MGGGGIDEEELCILPPKKGTTRDKGTEGPTMSETGKGFGSWVSSALPSESFPTTEVGGDFNRIAVVGVFNKAGFIVKGHLAER